MATVSLRIPPKTAGDWERFHFAHYNHHRAILAAINAREGTNDQMPPQIWPFNPRDQYPYNQAHQFLHNQMGAVDAYRVANYLNFDFSKADQVTTFFWLNWSEHQAFDQLIGT